MRRAVILVLIWMLCETSSLHADYLVHDRGDWPTSWPRELDQWRDDARTYEGPKWPLLHYGIPFTKREDFEAAWPHLLKVATPGAPIVLRRPPSFWLDDKSPGGVCIHTPPAGETAVAATDAKGHWERTIYIELIVDGDIVDLNRIAFPPDTPINDQRFKDQEKRP